MSASATALPAVRGLRLDRDSSHQLLQLRGLRLRRAEVALAQAAEAVEQARLALQRRQQRIVQTRAARSALQHAVGDRGGALAPCLPRWVPQAEAQRARLDEQLERETYALIDDERDLERAQDALRECQQALARLQQREDLARALLQQQGRERRALGEQRRELELEDRRR